MKIGLICILSLLCLGSLFSNIPELEQILNRYERPFTLLDISGKGSKEILQLADEYDSVFVIAEEGEANEEIIEERNSSKNVIHLHVNFTPSQLQHLSECEHFDVILAGDIRAGYQEKWQNAIDSLLNGGDHILIQGSIKDKELQEYIFTKGGIKIGTRSDHSVYYLLQSSNHYLLRKTWLRELHKKGLYRVESTYKTKKLMKSIEGESHDLVSSPWVPGINLCTFKMCHGDYPNSKQLIASLSAIKEREHTDWMINNMIIQGRRLTLIDFDDPISKRFLSDVLYASHEKILSFSDPQKFEHYFWHTLIQVPVTKKKYLKLFAKLFPPSGSVWDFGPKDAVIEDAYAEYGVKTTLPNCHPPDFCHIRLAPEKVYPIIKSLPEEINCVAFRFHIQSQKELTMSLDHLSKLGYREFNFSARNIPCLVLDDNRYRGIQRDWAKSVEELLEELQKFKRLDHDEENLWGTIYAKKSTISLAH